MWTVEVKIPVLLILIAILFGLGVYVWTIWMSTADGTERSHITVQFPESPSPTPADLWVTEKEENLLIRTGSETSFSLDGEHTIPMELTTIFCAPSSPTPSRSTYSTMEEESPGRGSFADGEKPMDLSPTSSAPSTQARRKSIFLPNNGPLDGPITHLFTATNLPITVTIDEFFTLQELESQNVVLKGVGLLKYRAVQWRLRFYARRLGMEGAGRFIVHRNKRRRIS
ncbi:hypothetical protein Clacol_002119 [Clathrus columnatus]|uniref:Uncharacterized protein n=1 Tax=Clathrus columnatus TaxID=1419009 RepID=A0AAV5A3X5_9AGAM|nr:hypothetical protein Clacol_002119 [Clathrus columnatus]